MNNVKEELDEQWCWPTEAANAVQFYWPGGFNITAEGHAQGVRCRIEYDAAHRYLHIVDSADTEATTPTVYDTIDLDDTIGADLSIAMRDSNDTTTTAEDSLRAHNDDTTTKKNEPAIDATPVDTQATAQLTLYVYPRQCRRRSLFSSSSSSSSSSSNTNKLPPTPHYQRPSAASTTTKQDRRVPHFRTLTLCPAEDLGAANQLLAALHRVARPAMAQTTTADSGRNNNTSNTTTRNTRRSYLLIVNPRSGPRRNVRTLATEQVIPLLRQAAIEVTLCVTTHAGHAAERCRIIIPTAAEAAKDDAASSLPDDDNNNNNEHSLEYTVDTERADISTFDGLIVMGGDGSMHEILNGLRARSINNDNSFAELLQSLPLGIIGCGTANGLSNSLAHANAEPYHGILTDAFAIAKGHVVSADLSTYQVAATAVSVLPTNGTNNNTSTDSKSNHTGAVVAATDNATDKTSFHAQQQQIHEYTSFLTFSWGIIAEIDIESERIHWVGHRRFDLWAVHRVLWLRKYKVRFSYSQEKDVAMPPISDPVPSNWTTIEDDVILFWATHVTHASMAVYLSPQTKVQDGVLTILLVRGNVWRLRLAAILLGLETGSHEKMPGAEWIQCTAFRLEPVGPTQSFNNLDGEVVTNGPIQARVMPNAVRFFGQSAPET